MTASVATCVPSSRVSVHELRPAPQLALQDQQWSVVSIIQLHVSDRVIISGHDQQHGACRAQVTAGSV